MNEHWKPIKDYEGIYEVSDLGRVKSLERTTRLNKYLAERILKQRVSKEYYIVHLSKDNVRKFYRVNRLVAQAFLPNPDNLPIVNHKNEIKLDNRLENLEWTTSLGNANYGTRNERLSKKPHRIGGRKVVRISSDGSEETLFISIREAAKFTGISRYKIASCCENGSPSKDGSHWHYKI